MAEPSPSPNPTSLRTVIDYYNNPEYVRASRAHAQKGGRVDAKLAVLRRFIRGGPVLELGGGAGLYAGHLPGYLSVDISLEAIRHAEAGHGRMVCGDIQALPLRDASVAAVFTFNVLEHIHRPDQVMEEIDRVLMPGGTVLLKDAWRRASLAERTGTNRNLLKFKSMLESRVRLVRHGLTGDAKVEYSELVPDYSRIGHDHDAVSSIDEFSVFAFFARRGYACLNLRRNLLLRALSPYREFRRWVIVRKPGGSPSASR
jgi:SAM-dependent methyltransferase